MVMSGPGCWDDCSWTLVDALDTEDFSSRKQRTCSTVQQVGIMDVDHPGAVTRRRELSLTGHECSASAPIIEVKEC